MGPFNATKLFPKGASVVEVCFEPGQSLRVRVQDFITAADDGLARVSDVVFAGVARVDIHLIIDDDPPRIESSVYRLQDATHASCRYDADLPLGLTVRTDRGSITAYCRTVEGVLLQKVKVEPAREPEDRPPD